MTTIRLLIRQAQVCFILFASIALAALQNVTVDDAATTGAVVPTYLPSPTDWQTNYNCTGCYTQPDTSLSYDGTWHHITYSPTNPLTQAFEFTFVGSGLYIYFILANYVPGASTLTNLSFNLDGVPVSTFLHDPASSTYFEYNQAVYASSSIPYGQHTMVVSPINDTVNNVLMIFDYLVYTTNTTVPTSTTTGSTFSVGGTSSSTLTGVPTASSGPNIGAIVGGIIAGVGTIVIVTIALLCYRRHKRRTGIQSSPAQMTVVEPFALSHQILPTSPGGTYVPNQQMPIEFTPTEIGSRRKITASPTTAQSSAPGSTATQSVAGASSSGTAEVLEQVVQLRDEVARLRRLQDQSLRVDEFESEPPPEYS